MVYGKRLRSLSLLTAATIAAALALVFFYAPNDADQGFVQKIFYLHVPMAIVALCGFVFGGIMAIQHLRTRRPPLRPALLRGHPHVADPRRRRARHRVDLGQAPLGRTGGCGTSRRWSPS